MTVTEAKEEIHTLEKKLTGDMFADMKIREEISSLKRMVRAAEEPLAEKPVNQDIECFNCGS